MEAVAMSGGPVSPESRSLRIGLVGQLQRAMPELSADDAFDTATMFIRESGALAPSLEGAMQGVQRVVELGGTPENILARLTTAVQAKQKPRIFNTLASVMSQIRALAPPTKVPGRPLTERQQLQMQTQGMSVDELMDWLDEAKATGGAEKLVGSTWASVAPLFGPGVGGRGLESMRQAMGADVYAAETGAIRASRTGGMITGVDMAAAAADELKFVGESKSGLIRNALKNALQDLVGYGATRRKLTMMGFELQALTTGDPGLAAMSAIDDLRQFYAPTRDYAAGFGYGTVTMPGPHKDISDEMLRVLQRLEVAINLIADRQNQPVTVNVGAGMD